MSADELSDLISWSVYNERQGVQIDGLTSEQAWKIIAASDPKTRQHWLLWHDGLTTWKSVADFENANDLLLEALKPSMTFPAVPSEEDRRRAEEERRISTFDLQDPQVSIDLDDSSVADARQHRRFKQRYLVEIHLDGQVFKTATIDISLGGMRIEDPLPTTTLSQFRARLIQEGGSDLYLKCAMADPYELKRDRIRFLLDEAKVAALRTWLLEHPVQEE